MARFRFLATRGRISRLLLAVVIIAMQFSSFRAAPILADSSGLRGDSELAWSFGDDGSTVVATLPDAGKFEVQDTPLGQTIIAEGFMTGAATGHPQLPVVALRFLVPPGIDWGSVELRLKHLKWVEVPGKFDLAPAPPAAAHDEDRLVVDWGTDEPGAIRDGRDVKAYQSDFYLPADPLSIQSVGAYRQWKIISIEYRPFSYNPTQRRLRRLHQAELELRFERVDGGRVTPNGTSSLPGGQAYWEKIRGALANPEAASQYYLAGVQSPPPGRGAICDYVIITTSSIQQNSSQLGSFVAAKDAAGYAVKVVTEGGTEDDTHYVSGNSADARADNIRNWLVNHYLGEGIEYVLLMGNPDSSAFDSSSSVPMKMCYPRNSQSSYKESPTDMYFSDLTGDWDVDGDGKYGEASEVGVPGGIDRIAEVDVGRIPFYGSYSDLDSILSKTVTYMQSVETDWRKSLLVVAAVSNFAPEDHNQDGDASDSGEWRYTYYRTFGADWGEALRSKATGTGISAHTQYERSGPYSDGSAYPLDACDAALNKANFLNEWGEHYGFVTWWGHGSSSGAYRLVWNNDNGSPNPGDGIAQRPGETAFSSFITSSDASQLSNDYPSYVVQVSCNNGWPENSINLGYSLLQQGAIGTVSSSRVSWYAVGSWSTYRGGSYGDNASYAYYIFQHMAQDDDTVGRALARCRADFGLSWTSGSSWMNCCDFNLYGDPSLSLVVEGPPNQNPYTPSVPSPPDGATGQSLNAQLSWSGGDPDAGDTVTYNVYFEADNSNPGVLIGGGLTSTSCDPGALAKNTHYYWKVVSTDDHGAFTEGTVWDFYTQGNYAPSVEAVSPINGCCFSGLARTFTTTCSDPNGWQDIKRVLFSIGQDFSAADGFLAYYDQPANRAYLSDDEGTGWIGGFAPGSAQTIENSRAILHLEDMSTMGEGNLLTATWSITFKSPVFGEKHSYLDVVDAEDVSSGWQQMGDSAVFSPIPLVPGWNLISIPASPESTAVADVLSAIDGQYDLVCAYDAVTETWKTYQVGGPPEGNTLTNIDETMGFWIRATALAELTLDNCSPSSVSIELYVGWNLIGYPSGATRPISEALAGIAGKYDMVCAYDATDVADPWKRYDTGVTSVFNDLTEMDPGYGYWVHALESCLWSPGAAPGHSKAVRAHSIQQDSPDSGMDLAPPPLPLRLGGE